jgi:hypothetical protein
MESVKHNSVLSTAGLWRQIGGGMARGISGSAGANGAWAGQLGSPGTAPLRAGVCLAREAALDANIRSAA